MHSTSWYSKFELTCLLVYSLAHMSKAVLPKDPGGPFGHRIGVTVGGEYSWGLRVVAFETGRASLLHEPRYSLVVLNCKCSVILHV